MLRSILAVFLAAGALAAAGPAHAQQRNLGIAAVQLRVPGEAPVQLYGESHALVIGASAYSNGWPRLGGVLGDVRAVSAALRDQGFRVSELLNPTLAQLDGGLRKFIGEHGQNPGNRLLIYFAGHGHTLKSAAGGELGYIVPVDAPLPTERNLGVFKAAAMSMDSIENFAKQIDAKHALFLFDSCFSGTFFKMRAAPESISLKTAQPVRQFITAGSAEQQVPDVSVFRQQFIAGIRGEADLNGDGYVTGSDLGMFLEDKVTNYSRRTQTPQYGKIRDPNLDKGDFVFLLPGRANRPAAAVPAAAAAAIDPLAVELSFWDSVKDSRSADELRAYLGSYPSGRFAELARARMRSLEVASPAAAPTQLAVAPPSVQTLAPTAAADDLQRLAAGTVFRDCADCPEMVVIPPGRFAMGSPDSESGRMDREGPVHTVAIPRVFGVGKFEVTKGQFARFVRESGHSASGGCYAWTGSKFEQDASKDWRNPGFPQTDNDPVVCVNWNDAKAYAQWLTQKSGKPYRLLTEAEWEYAARAGRQESRPWGDNPNDACRYANVADQTAKQRFSDWTVHACADGHTFTAPVGSFQPNAFGLHDMIGNAWEWTEDCGNDTYAGAPSDGSAWASGECGRRVLRGGSWGDVPRGARSAIRGRGGSTGRSSGGGFRLARTN